MFKFLRRKKDENSIDYILNVEPLIFAQFTKDLFDAMEPGSRAHVLVAYENLIPLISALQTVSKKQGGDYSIDEFILDCAKGEDSANDEINTRRYAWFMWAGFIYRLSIMCDENQAIRDILASIWCDIARASPLLKTLLPDNIVWKDEEKVWFEYVLHESDKDFVVWTISHGGPRIIWKSKEIKRLSEEFDLFYFDGGGEEMTPITNIPKRPLP